MGHEAGQQRGAVAGAWRYPVKSFQGSAVDRLELGQRGAAGDRAYGLIDVGSGRLLSAKRMKQLLEARADDERFSLPDGTTRRYDDPDVVEVLSAWLGRPVHLARPDDADLGGAVAYEMTFDPPNDDADLFDIPTPTGTFLDLADVHLLTTATLDGCRGARPDLDWDVRRFRPNLLVAAEGPTFLEQEWLGRRLRVGGAVLSVDQPTVRCAMPLRAQPGGLDREPGLFQAMSELNELAPNHLGVYCTVVEPGPVAVGDPVVPED